jgi:hypothetical protein
MKRYLHSPIRLHGEVFCYSTKDTLPYSCTNSDCDASSENMTKSELCNEKLKKKLNLSHYTTRRRLGEEEV